MDELNGMITYEGEEGPVQSYLARPRLEERRPAVIVIHEIWGLLEHTRDVANRFAQQGYVALAPHLYSRPALVDIMTPEKISVVMQFTARVGRERLADKNYVEDELQKLPPDQRETVQQVMPNMFGGMPKESLTRDLVRAVNTLRELPFVKPEKIGSIGFCFGGGMSINLACQADLAGCVLFYGENPSPIERVEQITCPVMGLYGAEDMRINNHLDDLVRAMAQYRKDFEMKIYPGAGHAFFNDTNPTTYRENQAMEAWERVLGFFDRTLGEEIK